MRWWLIAFALPAASAAAQQDNVITASEDAFGTRVGNEQIGLYASGVVRGFDLAAAGNYRIDGAYFVKAADPAQRALDNTTTRLGVTALRYDFTAPSGIVEFQLKPAPARSGGSIEAGFQSYRTEFLQADLGWAGAGGTSVAGGFEIYPDSDASDGTEGSSWAAAILPRGDLGGGLSFTGLASYTWRRFGSDNGIVTTGPFLPPKIERRVNFGEDWTHYEATDIVAGGILGWRPARDWLIRASSFYADYSLPRSDFNLFVTDRAGIASHTAFASTDQRFTASSSELAAAREWQSGRLAHRLILTGRYRDSRGKAASGYSFDYGSVDLLGPIIKHPEPDIPATPYRRDHVEQWSLGGGYRLGIGDILELRADGQRTHYRKAVRQEGGPADARTTRLWLYSASLLVNIEARLTGFASISKGLEESGSSPRFAANSGEVLPAVVARQKELGLKYQLGRLNLVGTLFDTRKVLPGIDPGTNRYDLIGKARHRGLELSLAGSLSERLTVVLGALALDARLSGPLVDAGVIGERPAGRSERVLLANLDWRLPGIDGLSVDLNLDVEGRRAANAANSFDTPAYARIDLGARYGFAVGRQRLKARLRILNLLDDYSWIATSSDLLFYSAPRSVWVSLQTAF